ncbi:hypothetical protein [Burkholderia sp. Ac-20379]|uniref:hypothetical protein n=1 Tax=Burkholderia sp. Ac-20379 TaxID=2703900 RepID=UPI00197F675B|nr:hypothetical protein [Burkholderia sp. Ac-20379]MBN3727951.1 hypothetical protein [Burkholderia sp. Ac-20379]
MWPFKKRPPVSAASPAPSLERDEAAPPAPAGPAYCYVEFESHGETALRRLTEFFSLVKAAKERDAPADEAQLSAYLTDAERACFSNLSAEETAEWNEFWFSTPLPKRHSPEMPTPGWDFASMLDAFWHGDYDLVGILPQATRHVLAFNPHGYPYGSTGSLVAMVECFGHRVVGVDDGTGYEKYVPCTLIWKPRARRAV